MELQETTKICNKCHKEFPSTSEYFHKDNQRYDGLRSTCKKCHNAYRKQYFKSYIKQKSKNIPLDENWQDNTVIQRFKKLYSDDLLPIHKIYGMTKLSISNIQFLIEELGIKISKKERYKLVRKKKEKYFTSIRPSKEYLERQYEEAGFSMQKLKEQYTKIPLNILSQWFDELGIQRRWALRFQNREQRLQNIIKHLKRKI